MLGQKHGWGKLEEAVSHTFELGCFDASAVQLLLEKEQNGTPKKDYHMEIGMLSRYDRPQPAVNEYDWLLRELPKTEVIQ